MDEPMVSFGALSQSELTGAKAHWTGERTIEQRNLEVHEAELKRKNDAKQTIEDRLNILHNVLRKELEEETVHLAKYKQVKEAITNTKNLLEGIQPPIDRLVDQIEEIKERLHAVEANIKIINAELGSRGKVIEIDRFRSTQEDPV